MIADRQLKLKTNEPLFFINIPTTLEYANISRNFSLYLEKILNHCFPSSDDIPKELKNKIASSLLNTKLKEEIASTLNKIQSIHKQQNKTLLDLQDLHLAFQMKNELIPKIKEKIELDYLQKDYIDLVSLFELYALDKISKTNNIIAYITNLSTSDEIQNQIKILNREKINFKYFTINLEHIITSIERKNLFYIFIKDKMFATIYAPMLQ
jgi:hypothetical protein